MAQVLRDPTAFQSFNPATGVVLDFDMGSDGRMSHSPAHYLRNPPWTFEGRASGLVALDHDAVTEVRGTIQVEGSYKTLAAVQTILYFAPGTAPATNGVEVGVTAAGKATFKVYNSTGSLVVSVTTSLALSDSFWLRFAWDSTLGIAQVWVNGQVDSAAVWAVTPATPWAMLPSNYVGIMNAYGGVVPMSGTLRKVFIGRDYDTTF